MILCNVDDLDVFECQLEDDLKRQLSVGWNGANIQEKWTELKRWLLIPPAYTCLRMNLHIFTQDEVIARLQEHLVHVCEESSRPSVVFHPDVPEAALLRVCSQPLSPQNGHRCVIVDVRCGGAVLRGADIFVPGVLGMSPSVLADSVVDVFADVDGKCLRGAKRFDGRVLFVGHGAALLTRKELFGPQANSDGVAVRMLQRPWGSHPPLPMELRPYLFPQNLPSIVCVRVLDPRPGDSVLDLCAAPGGKTTHIAAMLGGHGVLVAVDRSPTRLSRVRDNLVAWQLDKDVRLVAADASNESIKASVGGPFDKVLVDAPCSALGQRPALRVAAKMADVQSFPALQRAILSNAVDLVRPGGVLVYSTCTITTAENEEQVAWLLAHFQSMQLEAQSPCMSNCSGLPIPGLNVEQQQRLQRFGFISGDGAGEDTIGFFLAKFRKRTATMTDHMLNRAILLC